MEVVACPACGQANSLPVGMQPAQAQCASCDASLAGPPPRYYVAQGQNVQGPFERAAVLQLIQQGKVRPEMMFCEEDTETWVPGHDCPDLFPHLARPAARMPGPVARPSARSEPLYEVPDETAPVPRSLRHDVEHAHHAHHKPPPPGGVIFAAILDFIIAIDCIWYVVVVVRLMNLVDALTDEPFDKTPFIVPMLVGALLGLGFVVAGLAILRGSARVLQYVMSGFIVVFGIVALRNAAEAQKLSTVLGIALSVLAIVLISTPRAAEFFSGHGQRRGGYRGGGPRGGRYRRGGRRSRRRRRYS